MKKILFFAVLFICFTSNSQTFGASGLDVTGTFVTTKPIYGEWLRLGNTPDVTMKFPQTPQGIKDALSMVKRMLVKNEIMMEEPDIYKSIESDNITVENPEALSESIQKGESRINLAWFSPDGSTLHLFLGKYSYEVNVMKAYKM